MNQPRTIALVAGEASGDQLGGALLAELGQRYPKARFVGIGGEQMQRQGLEAWWDCSELAVFGLFEVLSHFPRLLRLRRELTRRLLACRPDLFVGIDAPDFNLGLEVSLRRSGIRTVHYVSPTVWAWRQRRVRKIARAADRVLCLFPFEPKFYAEHGVDAVYVGHPLADQIDGTLDKQTARQRLGLDADVPVLALLPGSRQGEIERLGEVMLQAARLLAHDHPGLRCIVALANPQADTTFQRIAVAGNHRHFTPFRDRTRTVIAAADVVLCASGTATLETMLVNRPMVMTYKLAPSTFQLAKHLKIVRKQFFALPNILAGKELIPELIQDEASASALASAASRWLQDDLAREQLRQEFTTLHQQLRCNAAERAADAVAELLPGPE